MHNRIFTNLPRLRSDMTLPETIDALEQIMQKKKNKTTLYSSVPFALLSLLLIYRLYNLFGRADGIINRIAAIENDIHQTAKQMWWQFDNEINPASGNTCINIYPTYNGLSDKFMPCWNLLREITDLFCLGPIEVACQDVARMKYEKSYLELESAKEHTWLFVIGSLLFCNAMMLIGLQACGFTEMSIRKSLTPNEQNILANILENNNTPEISLDSSMFKVIHKLKEYVSEKTLLLPNN